jgi:hypothetical protein
MTGEDDFWSIALLPNNNDFKEQDDLYENECSFVKTFTILPPKTSIDDEPLVITVQMNNNKGVLDDVSGIPWDASLLLSGYLYGTDEGRLLCSDACRYSDDGGILELGSGLGIAGLAALAAAVKLPANRTCKCNKQVVFTDRNDTEVLKHLKKNVDANIDRIKNCDSYNNLQTSKVSIEACDWMEVSTHLQTMVRKEFNENSEHLSQPFPRGPFNLIIGSALVYVPEHASACADTIYYLLSDECFGTEHTPHAKRKAVIVQLPDRSGFTTHFLPQCYKLGLDVLCKKLDEKLIERVEAGLSKTIASARDYRMYFISKK